MPIKIKFLSAGGSGGGGTDTNLGNANLTAERYYKVIYYGKWW